MKFINKISSYLFIVFCIAAFGLFIYPGLYKYDKLQQKYPVKINRITGETQVLFNDGWRKMDGYDGAVQAMEHYKREIEQMISDQNDRITSSVLAEVKSQLEIIKQDISNQTTSETSVFENVRNRNEVSDEENTKSQGKEYFTQGDTTTRVKEVMGTPTGISGFGGYETWFYDSSMVNFEDGKVTGWHDLSNNLLV
ncbi:hypothetical protein M3G15_13705, partial [Paenibacillus sp. p3-SID1389]|uniref:hypothetical protein n=1 Tax=Paenibacillus sp. p3-SID1389 TaxID=2916364 RepID=UPI0021A69D9F